jgi:hypothetical protein
MCCFGATARVCGYFLFGVVIKSDIISGIYIRDCYRIGCVFHVHT